MTISIDAEKALVKIYIHFLTIILNRLAIERIKFIIIKAMNDKHIPNIILNDKAKRFFFKIRNNIKIPTLATSINIVIEVLRTIRSVKEVRHLNNK